MAGKPDFEKQSLAAQLADRLSGMVREGVYSQGGQLPPTRRLADEFGVSVNTAQSALRLLAEQDLVELRPRQGVFVKAGLLPANRSGTHIGLITGYRRRIDDITGSWSSRIAAAFERAVADADFHLVTLPFDAQQPDVVRQVMRRVDDLGEQLGGVMCFVSQHTPPILPLLDRRGIPWTAIHRPQRRSLYNYVDADNISGGRRLGRCLCELGRTRVLALVNESMPLDKLMGLLEGFVEAGQPVNGVSIVRCPGIEAELGYQATREALANGVRPEAVFASGDFLALGAMRALQEAGMRVPEDVGVIGSTGIDAAALSQPALTVLEQPMEQMGQQAALMLIEMVREGVRRMVGRQIPSPITFRDSLAVPEALRRTLEAEYRAELDSVMALIDDDDI